MALTNLFVLERADYEDLCQMCMMTEQNPAEVVKQLVRECLALYRDMSGRIEPKSAYFYENRNPAKQKAWNAAHPNDQIPDTKVPCWYLYDTSIYERPYRVIIVGGAISKVPAETVELI